MLVLGWAERAYETQRTAGHRRVCTLRWLADRPAGCVIASLPVGCRGLGEEGGDDEVRG
jgi:hypothetical protein